MSQAKRLSEEDKNTLRQTNAVEFVHTCMTVALHQEFGVGAQRLAAVNARRDEVNGEMLQRMMAPAKNRTEQLEKADRWLCARLPEGAPEELLIPMMRGRPRKGRDWQAKLVIDHAATLEWRVYAVACAEVLRFGAGRLNRLHELTVENFRQLNDWAQEDGLDVAMERLCRCARDAYKVDVWVEDVPDPEYLRSQRQETRQQMRELEAEAIRAEVSRMRVPNVLPLSGAEMERRIQSAQSARQMPERGRRR